MELLLLPPAAAAAGGPIQTIVSSALRLPEPLLPSSKFIVSIKRSYLSPSPLLRLSSNARSPISAAAAASPISPPSAESRLCTKWMVIMEKPRIPASSKKEIIDYYVETLARVLGSEKEAQMCIYNASWQTHFGFCCDIDEHSSRELSSLPGVVSVRPDDDPESKHKDYSNNLNPLIGSQATTDGSFSKFFSSGVNSEYWIVRMEKPGVEVVSKAQMVDYYAQTLTKVMGNEKDAQVSIYHISWEEDFGFCCRIDEDCARELAGVPGVSFVQPDTNSESKNKDYKGHGTLGKLKDSSDTSKTTGTPEVKTKRLFVTGLSFYTSEKTLRAAFEGFGELVEVKIIMDKISKRSKGYAFVEYTTEDAASAALKEMNGKIINGWMIVVDVAKTNPPKYNRGRPNPSSTLSSPFY